MNRNTIARALTIAGITAAAGFSTLIGATAAHADSTPTVTASHGVIYLHAGNTTKRLTEDEVNAAPRLSPDATQVAYLHNNTVWVMGVDGTGKHQVSDRVGTAPAWTANGLVTYTAEACNGDQGTYRTGTAGGGADEVLSPAACVGQDGPQMAFITESPVDPQAS